MTLGELGRSDLLVGSAEVFENAPWLVAFTQFFISWSVIIGFLMYYFSYLCSLVFLSNKEFFKQVDAVKGGGESGGDRLSIKQFMQSFRGSDGGGRNMTGLDNIVLFVMLLSPNFKAFSKYAEVEDSDDEKARYSLNDTMGQFFLKSLPEAVIVLFILGMALSGLLLRILFQLSDVLTVYAGRVAEANLMLLIAHLDVDQYNFQTGSWHTAKGEHLTRVSNFIMAGIVGQSPNITPNCINLLGPAIEAQVIAHIGGHSIYAMNNTVTHEPGSLGIGGFDAPSATGSVADFIACMHRMTAIFDTATVDTRWTTNRHMVAMSGHPNYEAFAHLFTIGASEMSSRGLFTPVNAGEPSTFDMSRNVPSFPLEYGIPDRVPLAQAGAEHSAGEAVNLTQQTQSQARHVIGGSVLFDMRAIATSVGANHQLSRPYMRIDIGYDLGRLSWAQNRIVEGRAPGQTTINAGTFEDIVSGAISDSHYDETGTPIYIP